MYVVDMLTDESPFELVIGVVLRGHAIKIRRNEYLAIHVV